MKITAIMEGKNELLKAVQGMRDRSVKKGALYADAGHYMTFTAVPMNFRQHGPGWPAVRRGGSPLIDTGLLRQTISYTASNSDVVIGSRLKSAGVHNRGRTIIPRAAKMLAIPLVPPLTPTEARTKGPRQFDNTFIYKHRSNLFIMQRLDSKKGKKYSIRAIFLLRKSVKIKPRPFLIWKPENLSTIAGRWARYIGAGLEPTKAMTGGGPRANETDPRAK